ncbi:hypothetical protein FCV25MIE_29209, partial [Fagus crenata]
LRAGISLNLFEHHTSVSLDPLEFRLFELRASISPNLFGYHAGISPNPSEFKLSEPCASVSPDNPQSHAKPCNLQIKPCQAMLFTHKAMPSHATFR